MTLEMRRLADRRVALLLYTTLDRLVAACGEAQPWALLRTDQLASLREEGDWDVVLVDADLPADLPADLRRDADGAAEQDEDGQNEDEQGAEGLGDA